MYLTPSGLLFLSAPLDYENQPFHRLTVRTVDQGIPPLSSTQTLTVEVEDVNDQPPIFSRSIYNASVSENKDPGEPVIRVSVTDQDSGKMTVVLTSACYRGQWKCAFNWPLDGSTRFGCSLKILTTFLSKSVQL